MKTYIVNGTVVFEQKVEVSDIEINDGKITAIGVNLPKSPGATVIDAAGKYVFPGVVDFHTHFAEVNGLFTSNDSYTSGTKAAILNGVTTVNGFIQQNFNKALSQAITDTMELAKDNVYTHIRWHLTPTRFSDVNYSEISKWIERGLKTFKFYTTYKQQNLYLPYDKIQEILKRLRNYEPTVLIHCEDDAVISGSKILGQNYSTASTLSSMRNEESELRAVESIISICKNAQTDVIIAHVSSSDSMGQIQLAKRECPIHCEVTPPNIFLSEEAFLNDNGYRYNIFPPLRSRECRALMEKKILLDYAEIFSSNHRAYSKDAKDKSKNDIRNVPQGLPSVGVLFHLFTELFMTHPELPLHQFYRKLSSIPARFAGIYPQKGCIQVDSDADLLIVNMNGEPRELYGTLANSYNPWEGRKTKYRFDYVLLNGEIVVKSDKLVNESKMSGKILVQS